MKPGNQKEVLVVLGAGTAQMPLIAQAKELGLSVIGVDRNPQAPGFQYCNDRICASTHDAKAVMQALEGNTYRGNLAGVVTRSNGMPTVTRALVAERHGLPGPSVKSSQIAVSKRRTIEFAGRSGLHVPPQYESADPGSFRFPMVIKPDVTIEGKQGISLVRSRSDLQQRFDAPHTGARPEEIECEGYVDGHDVLAIAPVNKGKVYQWLLLDEHVGIDGAGRFFGLGFTLPSQTKGAEAVWPAMAQLARAFELLDGVLIAAFRISTPGAPVLIEVHLDLGGDLIMETLVPAMGVEKPFKNVLLRPFVGRKPNLTPLNEGLATLLYVAGMDKRDEHIGGKVAQQPGVIAFAGASADRGRRGYVLMHSACVAEHRERIGRILETLLPHESYRSGILDVIR